MPEKTIPLSRGLFAIVDTDDYDRLSVFKWCALCSGSGPIYAARKITVAPKTRKAILMHREIITAAPHQKIDHINGNSLDNRKANLRIATDQQNQRGFSTPRKGKSSIYRGVHFRKRSRSWIAQISVDKRVIHIGCFATEVDAAAAYNTYAIKHFGDFAQLNALPCVCRITNLDGLCVECGKEVEA